MLAFSKNDDGDGDDDNDGDDCDDGDSVRPRNYLLQDLNTLSPSKETESSTMPVLTFGDGWGKQCSEDYEQSCKNVFF